MPQTLPNHSWSTAVTSTDLPFPLHARGKVRDVYDLGESYLMVATDRISAFDHVLSPGIPGKGIILTQMSNFWFRFFSDVPNHLQQTDFEQFPDSLREHPNLRGRSVIVDKQSVIPVECVARGFLIGSGWKDYLASGSVCGHRLRDGLQKADRLDEPLFTPATKAETGHDENISLDHVVSRVGLAHAERMQQLTLEIYEKASAYASRKGIIIADTKIEFGTAIDNPSGELVWIDEALTPDSSRFWEASEWEPGENPASFDKQFVRDHLESSGWDKESAPPPLPERIIRGTLDRYLEAYERLTGDHDLRGGVISKP